MGIRAAFLVPLLLIISIEAEAQVRADSPSILKDYELRFLSNRTNGIGRIKAKIKGIHPSPSLFSHDNAVWHKGQKHTILRGGSIFTAENLIVYRHMDDQFHGLEFSPEGFVEPFLLTKANSSLSFAKRHLTQQSIRKCNTRDDTNSTRRQLQTTSGGSARWENCYTNEEIPRYLDIGIATDCAFYLHHSEKIESIIETVEVIVAQTNVIFSAQFNIRLRIKQLLVLTCDESDMSIKFNNCQSTIEQALEKFANWTKFLYYGEREGPTKQGLWHLLSGCYDSPGNIGIAYIQQTRDNSRFGTICEHHDTHLNVGVTSIKSGTSWLTFCHEVAHNFGARHSNEEGKGNTGGIMDIGSGGYYNGVISFNDYRKDEICHELDYAIHSGVYTYKINGLTTDYFTPFDPNCLDINYKGSCSSDGKLCQHGLCIKPEFEVQINGRKVEANIVNGLNLRDNLDGKLSLGTSREVCTPTIGSFDGKFLLVNISNTCPIDICKSFPGYSMLLLSQLNCNGETFEPNLNTIVNNCESPIIHINSGDGCTIYDSLISGEEVSIQLLQLDQTMEIIGNPMKEENQPSQTHKIPRYPLFFVAGVVVGFIAFLVLIVAWKRQNQIGEFTLDMKPLAA